MTLGERLKIARENKKWSQEKAAEKVGITKSVLSNYERDYRDPDTKTLKRLSDIYEVSTDYLLGKEEKEKKNGEDNPLFNTINEALQELKDEDTLLFMKDGNLDEETALLIKKALKNGIKFVDDLKKKE
ncbi:MULTISPECIES: helix-turn-helix domain-containing protein [Bacillus]|uniref:XRE family transcriptional regulator n=1 Tax=Bacillus swezeyi TaxID=1925020 RepID=A0A5M8RR59_9BACI|nr:MULTISPECIES: helix-turn-helix transcriptional regulator [Bacillus]KAA6449653.1 XRE family transcriptional regulator [Bacillus swezeyi]MCI4129583.1 helix-turn-helix domain-containing protein [Bacillus haynesii]MDE1393885.1 helix-turn-helix transcriptional regulator [Bacillus paralicheniformis]MEC1493435.1 helix-turn-helix transcriptional regulator [Bacillus licheniformis]